MKLQHIYLSSLEKKLFVPFFVFVVVAIVITIGSNMKHNIYSCLTSLKENTLAHVFDITILGVHWTSLLTPQNHDLECCHYQVIYSLLSELQLGKSLNTKPSYLNFEIEGKKDVQYVFELGVQI